MNLAVKRSITRLSLLLSTLFLLSGPAWAQNPGIRAGVSVEPDQLYFGGHLETAALVNRLHFRPNVDVGFDDDLTTLTANMEFVYKFPTRGGWGLYAGAGPALNIYMFNDQSDSEAGVNFLVGVEQRRGLFFEFKIGAIDSPDAKLAVGWTFR